MNDTMNLSIPTNIKELKKHLNDPLYKNSFFLVLSRVFNVACGFFFWMLANFSFTKKPLLKKLVFLIQEKINNIWRHNV